MTSTVSTTLTYGIPPPDGVRAKSTSNANPATGQRETNFELQGYQVQVENVRGKEDTVSLDSAGFQIYNRPSKLKSFTDEEEVKGVYYKESEELIKELTGASKVVLFDHSEFSGSMVVSDEDNILQQPFVVTMALDMSRLAQIIANRLTRYTSTKLPSPQLPAFIVISPHPKLRSY